jgi:hypothetical protein
MRPIVVALSEWPAYLVCAVLYLVLVDLWIVNAVFGRTPAWVCFGVYIILHTVAGARNALLNYRSWLVWILWLMMAIFVANMLLGRGLSGAIVVRGYGMALTYFLVAATVAEELGARAVALSITLPMFTRAVAALPAMISSMADGKSISRAMLLGGEDLVDTEHFISGVGSYTLYAAMVFAMFLLYAVYRKGQRCNVALALGAAAAIANVLLAGYLLPIALLSVGMIAVFLVQRLWTRPPFVIAAVLAVVVAGSTGLLSPLMVAKIARIAQRVAQYGIAADPTGRGYLATISISTASNNLLFGVGPYEGAPNDFSVIGGHSGVLDWLAEFGVFSLVFFGSVLYVFFKASIRSRESGERRASAAWIAIFAMTLVGALANPLFVKNNLDLAVFSALGVAATKRQIGPQANGGATGTSACS